MVTRGVVPILRHSAECFRRQTYPHRELLVVCDQNADAVENFFRSDKYGTVKMVRVPTGFALGNLRNIGIAHAAGDIIAQWDDDDLSDPERLTACVNLLLRVDTAAAIFLSRWLIWWPLRKLICVSETRPWEGSMLAWRASIPVYPAMEKAEDLFVTKHLQRLHPILLLEQPDLYVYTVTGRNTWDEQHLERLIGCAESVFRDAEYQRLLEDLAQRVPIQAYNADLLQMELARQG